MSTERTLRADADVPTTVDAGALDVARALVAAARGWPLEALAGRWLHALGAVGGRLVVGDNAAWTPTA